MYFIGKTSGFKITHSYLTCCCIAIQGYQLPNSLSKASEVENLPSSYQDCRISTGLSIIWQTEKLDQSWTNLLCLRLSKTTFIDLLDPCDFLISCWPNDWSSYSYSRFCVLSDTTRSRLLCSKLSNDLVQIAGQNVSRQMFSNWDFGDGQNLDSKA